MSSRIAHGRNNAVTDECDELRSHERTIRGVGSVFNAGVRIGCHRSFRRTNSSSVTSGTNGTAANNRRGRWVRSKD